MERRYGEEIWRGEERWKYGDMGSWKGGIKRRMDSVEVEDWSEGGKSKRGKRNSRPKASNGQQFPCPAKLLFSNLLDLSFLCRSRAAAPVGDEVL